MGSLLLLEEEAAVPDFPAVFLTVERKERREERVKKIRGAAEEEDRRELAEVEAVDEVAEGEAAAVEERREVVGSREL